MHRFIFKWILVLILCLIIFAIYQTTISKKESFSQHAHHEELEREETEEVSSDPFFATLQKRMSLFTNEGLQCKSVHSVIDRGDCFQAVLSDYLVWYLDQAKFDYNPIYIVEPIWEDILYGEINEDDILDIYRVLNDIDEEPVLSEAEYVMETNWLAEHWYVFSSIVPREYRSTLRTVNWVDTGLDVLFAVSRDPSNPKMLSLSISRRNYSYDSEYKSIYIHELAHMITLNEDQVNINEDVYLNGDERDWRLAAAHCPTYFTLGCMKESSYLFRYYEQFWKDIWEEYIQIASERNFQSFFYRHEDRFFNSYQANNPEEDIAESFVYFVMLHSNELEGQTEIKFDKVTFFYQFEELVTLRTKLLENIYDLSVQDHYFY